MKTNKQLVLRDDYKDISALLINFVNPIPIFEAVFWINKYNENPFKRIKDYEMKVNENNFYFLTYQSQIPFTDESIFLISNKSFIEKNNSKNNGLFLDDELQISLLSKTQKYDIIIYSSINNYDILSNINLGNNIFFSYIAQNISNYKNLEKLILQNE